MDPASWTVIAVGAALLAAIGASFRSLRGEQREFGRCLEAQGEALRRRIGAQGRDIGQLRERMAHLEGLLEGLREASLAVRSHSPTGPAWGYGGSGPAIPRSASESPLSRESSTC